MKHWNLLIWVPQFGISVVFPLILFIMLAVWLQERWQLGHCSGDFLRAHNGRHRFSGHGESHAGSLGAQKGQRRKAARPRHQLQQPRLVKRSALFL